MEIIEIAELLTALATLITVCLAVIELVSRRKSKNAEEAIEAYANYLIAKQQIEYAVNSALSIREKFDETKYKEYKSYAKVHILDSSLISLIQSIEKESITNSNPDNSSERERSIIIHEAAGLASNTVTAVNTFYQVILDYDDYSEEAMNDAYELIEASSKKLSLIDPKIQKTLYKNVKDIRRSSNKYILSLVCINLFLLTVCIILRLL